MTTIGFVGSSLGLTDLQRVAIFALLHKLDPGEIWHHGQLGADVTLHKLVLNHSLPKMVVQPLDEADKRARLDARVGDVRRSILPRLKGHRFLVDSVTHVLVAPRSSPGRLGSRSAPWYTKHYALRIGKPVTIIREDGSRKEIAKWDSPP